MCFFRRKPPSPVQVSPESLQDLIQMLTEHGFLHNRGLMEAFHILEIQQRSVLQLLQQMSDRLEVIATHTMPTKPPKKGKKAEERIVDADLTYTPKRPPLPPLPDDPQMI